MRVRIENDDGELVRRIARAARRGAPGLKDLPKEAP